MTIRIRKTEFDGLEAVEILTPRLKLTAVTSMGPRIAHFGARHPGGREGRNLLFWDYSRKYKRGQWQLMGGHRVWATRPLADETEETYADDNGACKVKLGTKGVDIEGAVHPVFRTRKSLGIRVLADDTLRIENRITNVSKMVWSGGVWGLTATLPKADTSYGIPLGREGAWDIFLIGYAKRWGGVHRTRVGDPAIRLTEDCLILKPQKHVSKRMVLAPQGIMGMTDPGERISFLKHSPYLDGVAYPMGCNISFYSGKDRFMVEMEATGQDRPVPPGATISNEETWMLREPVAWAKLKGTLSVK